MKKIFAVMLAAIMLFSLAGSLAESVGQEGIPSKIAGQLEEGSYILTVQVDPADSGEWHADEMAQDDSVVRLASAQMENGAFVVKYDPAGDGDVTVNLRHYNEHRVCDEIHSFDLAVREGKIQEVTGGSYTAGPSEDDLNPHVSGEWLEKDTQFTLLDVTRNVMGGWNIELSSPISHGAWVIRANAFYDCDYDALVYADGIKYDLPTDGQAPEKQTETGLWGTIKFGGTEEALELIWNGMDASEGKDVVFERAPALPPYAYSGQDEMEGAVANGLAASGLAENFLTEPGAVMIPVVTIHKTVQEDDTHAKVFGSFWILNYAKRGDVLMCLSGGEFPGIASLEKDGQGWRMTGLEEAGDGEDYAADLERFADGDKELLQKYLDCSDLSQEAQTNNRIRLMRDYVESNSLGITSFQDYGWDPVPLN